MDGLFSDEELFLTQNSFSEERVEDNFSIDSILYGLVACDEPVSQNFISFHFLVPLVVKRRH